MRFADSWVLPAYLLFGAALLAIYSLGLGLPFILAALGFRPEDVETLALHFLDAERRGSLGHGLSRIEWLETWSEHDTTSKP